MKKCLLGITDKKYLTDIIMKFVDKGYDFFADNLDNVGYAKVTS